MCVCICTYACVFASNLLRLVARVLSVLSHMTMTLLSIFLTQFFLSLFYAICVALAATNARECQPHLPRHKPHKQHDAEWQHPSNVSIQQSCNFHVYCEQSKRWQCATAVGSFGGWAECQSHVSMIQKIIDTSIYHCCCRFVTALFILKQLQLKVTINILLL